MDLPELTTISFGYESFFTASSFVLQSIAWFYLIKRFTKAYIGSNRISIIPFSFFVRIIEYEEIWFDSFNLPQFASIEVGNQAFGEVESLTLSSEYWLCWFNGSS